MCDCMIFPETVEEFIEQYKLKDDKKIYTNGVDLIPVFRIKQWMYHHMTPTADVEKVRHGKWIGELSVTTSANKGRTIRSTIYKCSLCNKTNGRIKKPYCPNCGAKMDGEQNDS